MFRKSVSLVTLSAFMLMTFINFITLLVADDLIKIAVMDIKAKQGVSTEVTSSLTDLVCTQIANIGTHEVISRDNIRAMLEHIGEQLFLEYDDTKYLTQVGGAMGAEQLLSGNIGMTRTTYLINMKLIDIDNAKVLKQISKEYMGDEAGLFQKVKECVTELYGLKPKEPTEPKPMVQPALQPAQWSLPALDKEEIKTEKKKDGFPWLWVGLGTLVLGGGVAAMKLLGTKEEPPDLSLPPGFPNAFIKSGN